jgi:hypothetical protein
VVGLRYRYRFRARDGLVFGDGDGRLCYRFGAGDSDSLWLALLYNLVSIGMDEKTLGKPF